MVLRAPPASPSYAVANELSGERALDCPLANPFLDRIVSSTSVSLLLLPSLLRVLRETSWKPREAVAKATGCDRWSSVSIAFQNLLNASPASADWRCSWDGGMNETELRGRKYKVVRRTCCPKTMNDSSTVCCESIIEGPRRFDVGVGEGPREMFEGVGEGRVGEDNFWGSEGSIPSSFSLSTFLCSSFASFMCSLYSIRSVRFAYTQMIVLNWK